MAKLRVCPEKGCPELIREPPCPKGHGRPKGAQWSRPESRDWKAHNALRKYIKATRGDMCERCKLEPAKHMHHVRPGNLPTDVLWLCPRCHKTLDTHAR